MACSSLTALARACGSEANIGGSEKLYMIAHKDLDVVTGSTYYSVTNGMVTDIQPADTKSFVEMGQLKATTGINWEYVNNPSTASFYYNNTLTTVLAGINATNHSWIDNTRGQAVVAMVKTKTGKFVILGLDGDLELATDTGGTGIGLDDLNGSTLTFTSAGKKAMIVDDTLAASLI